MAAARRYGAVMEPHASGAYVNNVTDEEAVGRAYRPDQLTRLAAVKDRYDPDNVFHLNHNIRPASGATLATHGSGAVTQVRPRDAVDASIWQRTDSLRPSRLSCLVRAIAGSGGRLE
jgi:Berberine and berberine like